MKYFISGEKKVTTVKMLADALGAEILTMPEPEREVSGGYAGDLLSWVMGRAKSGSAWVTVMSSVNTVAVASLADVALTVIAEGATLDTDALQKAEANSINVCRSEYNTYELCVKISEILK